MNKKGVVDGLLLVILGLSVVNFVALPTVGTLKGKPVSLEGVKKYGFSKFKQRKATEKCLAEGNAEIYCGYLVKNFSKDELFDYIEDK